MSIPKSSPWGPVQHHHVIAEGIVRVHCAGHGGIILSETRFAQMPACFRNTFAGGRAYEEDCDWACVAVVFPEHFSSGNVESAFHTLRSYSKNDAAVQTWLDNCPARATAEAEQLRIADMWHVGTEGSAPGGMKGIFVALIHNTSGDIRKGVMSDWPTQANYTSAELDTALLPIPERAS